MSAAPARVMGRPDWGTVRDGAPADLVLLDTETAFTLTADHLGSKSRNCPWLGNRCTGRPVLTMVGGRIAWADTGRFGDLV
jgi:dihydroorotase